MVPGAMIGAALAIVSRAHGGDPYLCPLLPAVGAAALSIGGVETYGQTVGLMQDTFRPRTYWWGALGLFAKGGLWFGIAGALVSLVLGVRVLWAADVARLTLSACLAAAVGKRLLNHPLRAPDRYPLIYFSRRATCPEDWDTNRPRQEYWGGLLFGLLTILIYSYVAFPYHPGLYVMALAGFLGGGAGFAVGEMLQAWGRWHAPFGDRVQPWIDWWKVMEMSFGLIAGAALGLGFYLAFGHIPRLPAPALPASWPWTIAAAWLIIAVAAANGCRPASRLRDVPMLSGLALIAVLCGSLMVATALVWGFVFYASAQANLGRWRPQMSPPAYWLWHALLAVASLVAGLAGMGAARRWGGDPRALLLALALSQTALTVSHALAEQESGGFRARLRRMKAPLTVQAGFLLLCGALWWISAEFARG